MPQEPAISHDISRQSSKSTHLVQLDLVRRSAPHSLGISPVDRRVEFLLYAVSPTLRPQRPGPDIGQSIFDGDSSMGLDRRRGISSTRPQSEERRNVFPLASPTIQYIRHSNMLEVHAARDGIFSLFRRCFLVVLLVHSCSCLRYFARSTSIRMSCRGRHTLSKRTGHSRRMLGPMSASHEIRDVHAGGVFESLLRRTKRVWRVFGWCRAARIAWSRTRLFCWARAPSCGPCAP